MTILYHDLDDRSYQKFKFPGVRIMGYGDDSVYVEAYRHRDEPTVYLQVVHLEDLRREVVIFRDEKVFLEYVKLMGYESGLL